MFRRLVTYTNLKMMQSGKMWVNLRKSFLPIEIRRSVEVLWTSGARGPV